MISVEGLTKYYEDHPAVRDVSFTVTRGEIIGLLGLNGAGKTTILRILVGDLAPSAGRVLIEGEPVEPSSRQARRQVGFLPETPPLYPEMAPRPFLAYVAGLRGWPAKEVATRVEEVLGDFGLADVADVPAGALSHGYRKRLGLAQAAVHRPRLLVLDEPISGLDPVQIVEIRQKIKEMAGQYTVILSSHILTEISQTCDRILMLKEGRLVAQGKEEELVHHVGRGVTLAVATRCTGVRARELLANLPGVTEFKLQGEQDGVCELLLHAREDIREVVARRVVEAGVGLLRLQPTAGQLEELFLELIGGASGPDAAAPTAPPATATAAPPPATPTAGEVAR